MAVLHVVAETPSYLRDAAKVTDEERRAIIDVVAADPKAGVEIKGSGGVQKLRIAGRGKGKSGGIGSCLFGSAMMCPFICSQC